MTAPNDAARRDGAPDGTGEARLRTVVVGVVDSALRERGAGGVVLAGPESPERRLLVRWLGERAVVPADEAVAPVREVLAAAAPDAPPQVLEVEARRAVARARAAAEGLLCAAEIHKTTLVLASALPPEPVLPLGDVWASEVEAAAGACTVPAPLEGLVAPDAIASVDGALRAHLESGVALEEALAPLESAVRERLADLLRRRPWGRFRMPLVPKLGARTVGIDLE